jgi:hypothetical protein
MCCHRRDIQQRLKLPYDSGADDLRKHVCPAGVGFAIGALILAGPTVFLFRPVARMGMGLEESDA